MVDDLSSLYFRIIRVALLVIGVFPKKENINLKFKSFLFYMMWPKVVLLIWVPLVLMATLKEFQFATEGLWEEFLDIMPLYFVGCNCLYLVIAAHRSSASFQDFMEGVQEHFKVWRTIRTAEISVIIVLMLMVVICFFFYIIGTICYGEVLVPLWVPFINNNVEYPSHVFFGIWVYEGLAGGLIFHMYGIVFPFIIFMTTVIIKELNYLICKIENMKFITRFLPITNHKLLLTLLSKESQLLISTDNIDDLHLKELCASEEESKYFIKQFVMHHMAILKVTKDLSKIHLNMFFTQVLFTVLLSCFLAFNMYYTERLTKVVIKSSPILVFSYYILFAFCLNGQRLTDKYEALFRSLYFCPWYDAPHTFKTSLLIIMQQAIQPVVLSGGGIFQASLHSFSQGVQQSISYILILKQLTPEKK